MAVRGVWVRGTPLAGPQYQAPMNCSDFVARFTEYLDGSAARVELEVMDAHLDGCPSCRRYKAVVEHGALLLRSLPPPELREDFEPRLRHRIYHVEDLRKLSDHASSGTPALSVLGMALVLTAVAWSPALRGDAPVIELDPIVVDRAPTRAPARAGVRPASGYLRPASLTDLDRGLWDNTTILYEYSPLYQRYRRGKGGSQVALGSDR